MSSKERAAISPTSLTAFRRVLAEPGVTLTIIDYVAHVNGQDRRIGHRLEGKPRKIIAHRHTGVTLEGSSNLEFGSASDWTFDGDTATSTNNAVTIVYRIEKELP